MPRFVRRRYFASLNKGQRRSRRRALWPRPGCQNNLEDGILISCTYSHGDSIVSRAEHKPIRASLRCSDGRLKSIMLQTEEAILRVSIDNRRGFSPLYGHR